MAAYNPYKAVKNISDLKGKYHTAKELGDDYMQYQNEAVQYYDELAKNGYQDIADKLAVSDYIKAQDILAEYKEDTTVDDFYDSVTKIGTGETAPKPSETVTEMLDAWRGSDDVRVDLTKDHYQTGKDQLDHINNFDYTKQPYYESIMETYNLYGDNAANGELATGATANAGNIDSYAAANAARQQLSFTNAGHQAALAAAQQNQDNWLDLYGVMGGNITDMGTINAQNLGTIAGMYNTDSAERQNALNIGAGLIAQDKQNEIDKYLADIGLEGTKYTTDAQERMNTENVGLEKYLGDLGYSSDLANYAAQERMNAADNNASYERLMAEIAGDKELAGINNEAAMAQLLKKYELENANAVKTAKSITNGSPLVDEEAAYKSQFGGTDTASRNEMLSYLRNAITQMRTGKYSDMTTFDDVRSAVLDVFPQFENEIDNYISEYTKQSLANTRGIRSLG